MKSRSRKLWTLAVAAFLTLIALYAATYVVTKQQYQQALSSLPTSPEMDRYMALAKEEPVSAETSPALAEAIQQGRDALALYAELFEYMDSDAYPYERIEQLIEPFFYQEGADPLDPEFWAEYRDFWESQTEFLAHLRTLVAAGGPVVAIDLSRYWTGREHERDMGFGHKVRTLARILSVDAMFQAAHGAHDVYAADLVALLQLAAATADVPFQYAYWLGTDVASIAFHRSADGPKGDKLSPVQLREIQEAALHAACRERFAQSFLGELQKELDSIDAYQQELTLTDRLDSFAGALIASDVGLDVRLMASLYDTPLGAPWRHADQRATVELHHALADAARLPIHEARVTVAEIDRANEQISGWRNHAPYFPTPEGVFFVVHAETEVQMDLLRLGLAIEHYQGETGALPPSLAAVQDRVEGGIPLDPFSGAPYVYLPARDTFLLYSVGRNATDNGGTPDRIEGDIVWRGKAADE